MLLGDKAEALSGTQLHRIHLIHEALPELNFDQISLNQEVLGCTMKTPFFVSSMTGGWKGSELLNLKLAQACERHSWIMGMGSQRKQLQDSFLAKEWQDIRKACPQLVLLGNLGLSQVIDTKIEKIYKLIEDSQSQGMIIHLNALQEAIQKEGTPYFEKGLKAIEHLIKNLPVPVIVKETGCGFSKKTLDKLTGIGLAALDLSGLGGTHWGRIEGARFSKNDSHYGIGETFSSWGISLCDSLLYAREKKRDYKIWASGGLRTGLEAAKALALGAESVGIGRPLLQALHQGEQYLENIMNRIEYELKVSLFCTGSRNLEDLKKEDKWQILS